MEVELDTALSDDTISIYYLLSQYSVMAADATEFHHTLLGKLYLYQNMGLVYMYGMLIVGFGI